MADVALWASMLQLPAELWVGAGWSNGVEGPDRSADGAICGWPREAGPPHGEGGLFSQKPGKTVDDTQSCLADLTLGKSRPVVVKDGSGFPFLTVALQHVAEHKGAGPAACVDDERGPVFVRAGEIHGAQSRPVEQPEAEKPDVRARAELADIHCEKKLWELRLKPFECPPEQTPLIRCHDFSGVRDAIHHHAILAELGVHRAQRNAAGPAFGHPAKDRLQTAWAFEFHRTHSTTSEPVFRPTRNPKDAGRGTRGLRLRPFFLAGFPPDGVPFPERAIGLAHNAVGRSLGRMSAPVDASASSPRKIPLFVRILIGLLLGVALGYLFQWGKGTGWASNGIAVCKNFADIVLRALRLLATPLIFLAVLMALVQSPVSGRTAGRLLWFVMTNTLVAIVVGLTVANIMKPGAGAQLTSDAHLAAEKKPFDVWHDLFDKMIPKSVVEPFLTNEVIPIIVLAVGLGIALRQLRSRSGKFAAQCATLESWLDLGFQLTMVALHWIFALIPFAVFAVVAKTVGKEGVRPLLAMGHFVLAVLVALGIQAVFYLIRLRAGSWVSPRDFLRGSADALTMAFSTASSAATLPLTFEAAEKRLKVREENASLGVMVGGTFNHDGTALYEAMAALFISQAIGQHLALGEQVVVVLMSVVASVGAAGIPEAGLVTMMAVFTAVKLPVEYIPLLLPLDWFLDRCRTAMNVMGDLTVTCLLDGKTPEVRPEPQSQAG